MSCKKKCKYERIEKKMYVTIPIFFIWLLWLFGEAFVRIYNTFLPEDKWVDRLKIELYNKRFVSFLSATKKIDISHVS
jgi:hypothetical protein